MVCDIRHVLFERGRLGPAVHGERLMQLGQPPLHQRLPTWARTLAPESMQAPLELHGGLARRQALNHIEKLPVAILSGGRGAFGPALELAAMLPQPSAEIDCIANVGAPPVPRLDEAIDH